ncbi:hypothetical protein AVJ24_00795 [Yersinia pestis]|nr:hypothetical protein AVJ24_00795 [Yersinia pestis]
MNLLEHMGKAAKQASWQLAMLSTAKKNQALAVIANLLESESQTICRPMSGIWLQHARVA